MRTPDLLGSTGSTVCQHRGAPLCTFYRRGPTLNQTLSTRSRSARDPAIISPSSGFTYTYSSEAGAFVRSTTSFGPIYAERAETVGRGTIAFGVSYQRFRFSNIDGIDIHKLPAVFSHIDNTEPSGAPETYEADVIQTTNNVSLNMDSTTLYGKSGSRTAWMCLSRCPWSPCE